MDARISYLRILACFMVILLHVAATDFHQLNEKWWPANFWDSITRVCVPVFFMISGAGLLTKNEALGVFLKKRFIKILPPLVFWSLFYAGWRSYSGEQTDNIILSILTGPKPYPLWYLYALIGLYAFTPVLRRFYQNSTRTEKKWFIGAWFITSSILPTINVFQAFPTCTVFEATSLTNTYSLNYFSGYVGYFFLGAYILETKPNISKCLTALLGLSALTAISTYLISTKSGQPCSVFYAYNAPNVVLASACFFSVFMAFEKHTPSKLVASVSSCTLGIYCLHMLFLETLLPRLPTPTETALLWIWPLLKSALIFSACFLLIYIARKIKPLRTIC